MSAKENLLSWADHHPGLQLSMVGGLILIALVRTLHTLRHPLPLERGHDWAWGWMIAAILIAGRWPMLLLPREFNQDESLMLAGAHALAHDPVFWRSIEGGTVGPLPFFALWPASWWHDWTGYFPARVTAVALLTLSLLLIHQCMAIALDRRSARIAVLAAVSFESLTLSLELVHYSSELLPMALLSMAAYAGVHRWYLAGAAIWNLVGGVALGSLPFAKLQAVPLGFCLGFVWLLGEFLTRNRSSVRQRSYLILGALLPTLLFSCQIAVAGEWENVRIPYLAYNVHYTEQGLSFSRLTAQIFHLARESNSLLHFWLPGIIVWIVVLRPFRRSSFSTHPLGWASLGSAVVALGCTLYPGKPFLHYWHFMILPLTVLLGFSLHQAVAQPEVRLRSVYPLITACALAFVGLLLLVRLFSPNPFLGNLAFFDGAPRTELSERVHRVARSGDVLAVWGWSSYVFVETGLRQITREACSVRSLEPSPYQEFYRRRYLHDFINAAPDLFLDSVGPNSTRYLDPKYRHDRNFPALAAVIRANYELVDEFDGARLYRRRVPTR